jgi:hypothetical protein
MTKRWTLAAAFLLTVVCGFLIVSFGSSSGVFAWGGHGGSTGAVQTQPSSPDAGATIVDVSIPADSSGATSSSSDTRRGDDDGEHREGDEHEGDDHDEGERD